MEITPLEKVLSQSPALTREPRGLFQHKLLWDLYPQPAGWTRESLVHPAQGFKAQRPPQLEPASSLSNHSSPLLSTSPSFASCSILMGRWEHPSHLHGKKLAGIVVQAGCTAATTEKGGGMRCFDQPLPVTHVPLYPHGCRSSWMAQAEPFLLPMGTSLPMGISLPKLCINPCAIIASAAASQALVLSQRLSPLERCCSLYFSIPMSLRSQTIAASMSSPPEGATFSPPITARILRVHQYQFLPFSCPPFSEPLLFCLEINLQLHLASRTAPFSLPPFHFLPLFSFPFFSRSNLMSFATVWLQMKRDTKQELGKLLPPLPLSERLRRGVCSLRAINNPSDPLQKPPK